MNDFCCDNSARQKTGSVAMCQSEYNEHPAVAKDAEYGHEGSQQYRLAEVPCSVSSTNLPGACSSTIWASLVDCYRTKARLVCSRQAFFDEFGRHWTGGQH